jgi:hypothetical protein
MRSWNGLATWLSTVNSCLSRKSAVSLPAGSGLSMTGVAGKFDDAPALPVERNTKNALDKSGLVLVGWPRRNI